MKLFVTDFDRTLFIDRKISVEDIESIKTWQNQGNLFAIATGRDINSIKELLNNYDFIPDYFICNNGAAIYDKDINNILSEFIDKEIILKVIEYLLDNYEGGVSLSGVNSKITVMPRKGVSCEKDFIKVIDYSDLNEVGEVYQIHKRFQDEIGTKALEEDLNTKFKNHIISYANSHNVDIVAKGVNKSKAIKYLEDNLINLYKITTMGDSYNDMKMILDYDGFIISSAKESLKMKVRNICSSVSECLSIISNID
ncbi:HAD-IIB family hydrolase [Clostridium sp. AL.422]|uniref:HAD-IIB family hydrolase n=1 Tax=Clostridium TaxID=1485 RepID=UPI00293DEBDE|nr:MULTISPECIES: HAD-IIB family hydrolase [unclassified Clostridium]MDV4152025.1 HAD-IIB family hydrolase [Clostridium sp. AL.422]